MRKVKIYSIEEPLLYETTEADFSSSCLTETKTFDEQDRLIRQEYYSDGNLESVELITYREDGKALSIELFYEPAHTLFRKNVFEYTENGALKREAIYIDGQLNSETIYFYDASGLLVRDENKSEDDFSITQVYEWHSSFKDCWVRKEISFDGELTEILTRDWENVQGEPFLSREVSERVVNPEMSRSKAFYKSREMENGVCWELFNSEGEYLEEARETCNTKGEVEMISIHLDPAAGSEPYSQHLFKYDERGNVIFEQRWHDNRIMETINSWFNAEGLLEKQMFADKGTRVFFYQYELLS